MERKIGEIFEDNGEWYQCVKYISIKHLFAKEMDLLYADHVCSHCDCFGNICEKAGSCSHTNRTDGTEVVFKKLEPVGEPYPLYGHIVQRYAGVANPIVLPKEPFAYYNAINDTVDIEVKQDKENTEDMEEKNLKPFDLEAAKAGKPVCTRDGRKARIICFDRDDLYPIVALIECEDGKEMIGAYSKEGHTEIYEIKGTDLMMLPEKKEGWVNIYYEHDAPSHREASWVYDKEEEAIKVGKEHGSCYIATVRIEWEE